MSVMNPATVERIIVQLTQDSIQQTLDDWEMQVEFVAKIGEGTARLVKSGEGFANFWNNDPVLRVQTQVERAATGPVQIFFSTETAWPLLKSVLCLPGGAERPPGGVFDDEQVEAFSEMMNMLCGSANTVYDRYGLRLSQGVDHLKVSQEDPGIPEDVRGLIVTLPYEVDGCETREIVQAMPFPLALKVAKAIEASKAA